MATIRLRRTKSGDKKYTAIVRMKGYPPQSATFDKSMDARRWAKEVEDLMLGQRYAPQSVKTDPTVGDAIDRYLREVLPRKPKSLQKQTMQLTWWKERIGKTLARQLTSAEISTARAELIEQVTTATVNRYMAALSHLCTMCKREWALMQENPCGNVAKLKESRGRVRFLTESERIKFLAECKKSSNACLYPIVILALTTGMRAGEIAELTWEQVDFDRKRIIIEETKNGERRTVPISGLMYSMLETRRRETGLVFPRPIRAAWDRAIRACSLANFRFHDLRHTAASYLAMNGATLMEISEILGHKTLSMVKRYAHLSEQHTSRVLERMNTSIYGPGPLAD